LIRRLAESTVSEIDNNGNRASFGSVKTNLPYYMNQLAFLTGEIEGLRHLTASMDTVIKCHNSTVPGKGPARQAPRKYPTY
ncbi:MAG: hypothetical protein V3S29_07105, partial [bacterium]